MKHEPCDVCKSWRQSSLEEDIQLAINCSVCKGTGFVRSAEDYVCNNCSGMLTISEKEDGCKADPYGLLETTVSGGYFSNYLLDCTNYTFSLCEKCLRDMFDKFVVPPYMTGACDSYAEDSLYHKEKLWKNAGGELEKLKLGLCNNQSTCTNPAVWRIICSGGLTESTTCDEHKKHHAINVIPFHLTEGIVEFDDASEDQKAKILNAYLLQNSKAGFVTYYKYVPGICKSMAKNVVIDDDLHAMLWIRNDAATHDAATHELVKGIMSWSLADGCCVIYDRKQPIPKDVNLMDSLDYYNEGYEE